MTTNTSPNPAAQQAMTLLIDAMKSLDEKQAEWLTALFYAALDQSPSDPMMAVKKAISSFKGSSSAAMSNVPLSIALAFDPMQHPRKKKGKGGGQFIKKGTSDSSTSSKKKTKEPLEDSEDYSGKKTPKHERDHILSREQIDEIINRQQGPLKTYDATTEIMKRAEDGGNIRRHGMTNPEQMVFVKLDGLEVEWNPKAPTAARMFIQQILSGKTIPARLLKANRIISFTEQANRDDDYWRKLYPNFVSSGATAGDGDLVVYHGGLLSSSMLAHESGHNLAYRLWGNTVPPEDSEYGKAQKAERPVSEYGANSPAEDFAEACRMYVSAPSREVLETDFPYKFAAVQNLIEGEDQPAPTKPIRMERKRPMGGPPESSGEGSSTYNYEEPDYIEDPGVAWELLADTFPEVPDELITQFIDETDESLGNGYWENTTADILLQDFQIFLQGMNAGDEEDEPMPPSQQVNYDEDTYLNIPHAEKTTIRKIVKENMEYVTYAARQTKTTPLQVMMELMESEFGNLQHRKGAIQDFVEREMAKW